jgi:hypothetical protein
MNIPHFFGQIQAATTKLQLAHLRRELYRLAGNGELDDDLARRIEEATFEREAALFGPKCPTDALSEARDEDHAELVATFRPRSMFPVRRHIASPDREKSRMRRRRNGLSRMMPDQMAERYSEALRSVGHVAAEEHLIKGQCTLPNDQIAALAGVCRSTVRNYRKAAVGQGAILVIERPSRDGGPNDTNIIRIIDPAWLRWLKKRLKIKRGIGCKGFNPLSPTKERDLNTSGFPDVDNTGDKPFSRDGPSDCREALSGAPS